MIGRQFAILPSQPAKLNIDQSSSLFFAVMSLSEYASYETQSIIETPTGLWLRVKQRNPVAGPALTESSVSEESRKDETVD
jgi:hypothetical protein